MWYSLIDVDGNAYSIMGYTQSAMREQGFEKLEINKMLNEAMSSDYSNLIHVCSKYLNMCNERSNDYVAKL